ncbi:MAG TPA: S1/P1 nuclease, partial [Stellaceae bacterium]|nr:S1/P1 nuclease [Stellaceae bacterium]
LADHALQQSDPPARAKLLALLATDKGSHLTRNDIASEATWADILRDKSEEARTATTPWHAVRLKPESSDIAGACFGRPPLPEGYPASHGPRENCSVDKILQFESELKNPETGPTERFAALQFLLNLVGDLNDPTLAIDRGDQGGDCTALQIGAKPPVRLSTYWQSTLVGDVAGPDPAKGVARLIAATPAADVQKWGTGTPVTWALDTYEVAKTVTYGFGASHPPEKFEFPPGRPDKISCAAVNLYRVDADYETKAAAAVRQQLTKAGIRLALVLRDSLK